MAYVKEISDIPLKRPQETFVDDPSSIDEVFVDDLVFDINHGIKNINKLHVFHAIVIICTTLKDIIKLQSNPQLFTKFKHQQLLKYGINLDEYQLTPPPPPPPSSSSAAADSGRFPTILASSTIPPGRSSTPPLSPPLKFAKLNHNNPNVDNLQSLRESTPDSLSNSDLNHDDSDLQHDVNNENVNTNHNGNDSHQRIDDNNNNDYTTHTNLGPYIPIEELVKNCSFEPIENPITDINNDKFLKEYQYNQDLKRQHQTSHLLKNFKLLKIPPLTIDQFLMRIKTYSSSISVSSYIHSASMLFKLCILLDIVPLTESNVYRLILASIRCSTKKLEDVYQKQKSFATVGGITTKDLFRLEVSFLYLCNFKLIISENVLDNFLTTEFTALRQFCKDNFES